MVLEVIAAALVGVAAVWLVLQPLIAPGRPSGPAFEPLDPEETPKGIALSALKEIEFDRETGKLSDEDYAFLKAKYTGAALEALRAEAGSSPPSVPGEGPDSSGGQGEGFTAAPPARQQPGDDAGAGSDPAAHGDVEVLIAARVRALRSAQTSAPPGAAVCPTCGPRPEPDAAFCSACGVRLKLGGACAGCGAELGPGSRFCQQCGMSVAA